MESSRGGMKRESIEVCAEQRWRGSLKSVGGNGDTIKGASGNFNAVLGLRLFEVEKRTECKVHRES